MKAPAAIGPTTSPLCLTVVDAIIHAPVYSPRQRRGQITRCTSLKTLLLVIHRHEGLHLPIERIAELTGLCSDSVIDGIKALRHIGVVDRQRGGSRVGMGPGSRPFVYRLNRVRLFELAERGRREAV